MTKGGEEVGPAKEQSEAAVTEGEMASNVEDERGEEEQEASQQRY